jgi:YHS domain-containing protein
MLARVIFLAVLPLLIPISAAAGEYQNLDAMGLASGKGMRTRCEAAGQYEGKTYCFHDEGRKRQFMADPAGNRTKADSFYNSKQSDPNWTPCDYSLPPSEPNSCE